MISLSWKVSVIFLLKDVSILVYTSPVLPRSKTPSNPYGYSAIADFAGYLHITNIVTIAFVDSFSSSSIVSLHKTLLYQCLCPVEDLGEKSPGWNGLYSIITTTFIVIIIIAISIIIAIIFIIMIIIIIVFVLLVLVEVYFSYLKYNTRYRKN